MRFEARDLKLYAEPGVASDLREGEVYFSVQFVDEKMLIPIIETWVYAGKGRDPEIEADRLYFQDVESYGRGIRWNSADKDEADFQVQQLQYIKHIFEYERALEVLMNCSLRRAKGRITKGSDSVQ